jgi:hypothetical protein
MDPVRSKILKTGAAATAMAAVPRLFAQQTAQGAGAMSLMKRSRRDGEITSVEQPIC